MPGFEVEVETPAAVKLDVKFSNGKTVLCEKGSKTKAILTGDEIGYLQAQLAAARKEARKAGERSEDCDGGGIRILDSEYSEEPPVGSKKHMKLHADEYEDGVHKSQKPSAARKLFGGSTAAKDEVEELAKEASDAEESGAAKGRKSHR